MLSTNLEDFASPISSYILIICDIINRLINLTQKIYRYSLFPSHETIRTFGFEFFIPFTTNEQIVKFFTSWTFHLLLYLVLGVSGACDQQLHFCVRQLALGDFVLPTNSLSGKQIRLVRWEVVQNFHGLSERFYPCIPVLYDYFVL